MLFFFGMRESCSWPFLLHGVDTDDRLEVLARDLSSSVPESPALARVGSGGFAVPGERPAHPGFQLEQHVGVLHPMLHELGVDLRDQVGLLLVSQSGGPAALPLHGVDTNDSLEVLACDLHGCIREWWL